MDLYSFIINNKEIFKVFYAFFIVAVCMSIVIKSHRFFQLSSHEGIRYFRNAFFFYGLAFIVRYFLIFLFFDDLSQYRFFIDVFFEFFIVMAGFFLLYSLLWRNFDGRNRYSSLFNSKISIFYVMSLIIVVLDLIWGRFNFMFLSQTILFLILSFLSYSKYTKSKSKSSFLRLYCLAVLLSFIAWILNAIVILFFDLNKIFIINVYLLNTIFFFLFLWGVIRAERIRGK